MKVLLFAFLVHAVSMEAKSVRSHTPASLFRVGQAAYVLAIAGLSCLEGLLAESCSADRCSVAEDPELGMTPR